MVTRCANLSVVIGDRHPLVLCGLTSVLHSETDFRVVATCRDATASIKAICELSPDIALLDIALPPASGLPVLAAINSEQVGTRAVFFSAALEGSAGMAAIAGGAYAVIPEDASPQLLVRCLRRVAAGQKLLPVASWDPELRGSRDNSSEDVFGALSALLTTRERQIIQLVGEGLSNKEVGRQLDLCDGTIKVHLHRIYQKLAIHNRTTLAVLAVHEPSAVEVEGGPTRNEGFRAGLGASDKANAAE